MLHLFIQVGSITHLISPASLSSKLSILCSKILTFHHRRFVTNLNKLFSSVEEEKLWLTGNRLVCTIFMLQLISYENFSVYILLHRVKILCDWRVAIRWPIEFISPLFYSTIIQMSFQFLSLTYRPIIIQKRMQQRFRKVNYRNKELIFLIQISIDLCIQIYIKKNILFNTS